MIILYGEISISFRTARKCLLQSKNSLISFNLFIVEVKPAKSNYVAVTDTYVNTLIFAGKSSLSFYFI